MKNKHCPYFCNYHCITRDCPNIQVDEIDEKYGFGIADDMGIKRTSCKKCEWNDKNCSCKDCYFSILKDGVFICGLFLI